MLKLKRRFNLMIVATAVLASLAGCPQAATPPSAPPGSNSRSDRPGQGGLRMLPAGERPASLSFSKQPGRSETVGPTLVSDKGDYAPGEIALLSGSGFAAGELIDLSIAIDDPATSEHIGDWDWTDGYADADGAFVAEYTVPPEAAGMTLTATAMGINSALVATATFTDHTPHGTHTFIFATSGLGVPRSITITGSRNIPASPHPFTAYSVTFTNPGPSAGIGAAITIITPPNTPPNPNALASTLTYSGFPASVPGVGGNYVLSGSSPASPIAVPTTIGTTTVTGTYTFVPCPTNSAPTLSASNFNAGEVCAGVPQTFTVTPASFHPVTGDPNGDPVAVTFSDGTTSKNITFNVPDGPVTLTLKATDNPSARNVSGCPALLPGFTTFEVQVSYTVHDSPLQTAPTVTAGDLNLGDICIASGTDNGPTAVSADDFNIVTDDAEGDPVSVSLDVSEVTLTLPEGTSDLAVSVPVVITATDDPSGRNDPLCPDNTPMSSSVTVDVTATLHRNNAPTITASDKDFGQIVGCLVGGSFQTTVYFAPGDFLPVTDDIDGDEVTVTADIESAMLVGPGMAEANVVLTATDDPSERASCLSAMSVQATVKVKVQVVYAGPGGTGSPAFTQPFLTSKALQVKRGSGFPVKFRLYDGCGHEICTDLGSGTPWIDRVYNQGNCPDVALDVDDAGAANDNGDLFRYSGTCGSDGQWIFNLKTNSTYISNATYKVRAHLNDGTMIEGIFSIKP